MQAKITSIVYTPKDIEPKPADQFARQPLDEAELVAGYGIKDDRKGGHPKRQLNVMAAETLDQLEREGFQVAPGQMGEQIIVSGLDVDVLPQNTRLRFGETAVIEVIEPRNGCDRFEHIQGSPVSQSTGRLGVIARVISGGVVRPGDAVQIMTTEDAHV